MRDTLEERLTLLDGDLQAAAEIRPPTLARARGAELRRAHRRRVAAGTALAAVGLAGAGTLVALRPAGGGQAAVGRPTATAAMSSPAMASPGRAMTAGPTPTIVVDLTRDTATVYDRQGLVLRVIPVSGGAPGHPSPVGVFTVTGKEDTAVIRSDSAVPGISGYQVRIQWVVELDAMGPSLYAMPWDHEFGRINQTHGAIGMSTDEAAWLYHHIDVGDRIEVK